MILEDLSGRRYGLLTVIDRAPNSKRSPSTRWNCVCDCGNKCIKYATSLKDGRSRSCGCALRENRVKNASTHGDRYKRLYRTWVNMKQRTGNPKHIAYKDYGGRGIKVCDEWKNCYEAFRDWALSTGYNDSLTIDRIDVNGNYEPGNCRWLTKSEQNRNQRSNVIIEFNGQKKTMAEWAKEIGITEQAMHRRINTLGWSIEDAVTIPKRTGGNLK